MYRVKSMHYGKRPEIMQTFEDEASASRFRDQQAAILKGYYRRTGMVDGRFVVFGKYDILKIQIWVERA